MEEVLKWIFKMFSFLVEKCLSWKLIGDFSILHFILGFLLLTVLLELISFGFIQSGGNAEYIGNLRRGIRNQENKRDRKQYIKSYDSSKFYLMNKKTGEIKK